MAVRICTVRECIRCKGAARDAAAARARPGPTSPARTAAQRDGAPLEEMVDLATPDVQGRGPHAEGCKAISGRLVRCQEAVAEVGIRVRSHRAISADRKETR